MISVSELSFSGRHPRLVRGSIDTNSACGFSPRSPHKAGMTMETKL